MGSAHGRLAAVAVMAALSTGTTAAQQGRNACLMTRDEFALALGSTVYSDPEAVAVGTGSVCTYDGGQIFLFSGDAAWEELEGIWAISGVGQNRTPCRSSGATPTRSSSSRRTSISCQRRCGPTVDETGPTVDETVVGCGCVVGIEVGRRLGAREPEYQLDPGPREHPRLSRKGR